MLNLHVLKLVPFILDFKENPRLIYITPSVTGYPNSACFCPFSLRLYIR